MNVGVRPVFGMELCAGICGLGLGLELERAIPGYQTVCAVEIEAANVAILAALAFNVLWQRLTDGH